MIMQDQTERRLGISKVWPGGTQYPSLMAGCKTNRVKAKTPSIGPCRIFEHLPGMPIQVAGMGPVLLRLRQVLPAV